MKHLPEEDLQHIYDHTVDLWEEVRNKSIFLTGGSGFLGKWLVESFLYMNDKLDLNATLTLLVRNTGKFSQDHPHLKDSRTINLIEGDITSFSFPDIEFYYVIHSAIDSREDKIELAESCIHGTKHILDFTGHCKARKFLFLSSGAVYGKQPSHITHVPEDYAGAPETMNPGSAYGESKRFSELLCFLYSNKYQFEVKIARCFAFTGPFLPLQSNYAIGNFIYDVLKGQNIHIQGDGTPRRSYLYTSDLMIWLWTILIKGCSLRPYNVGSDMDLSIFELADRIRRLVNPKIEIIVNKQKENVEIQLYVPSINRAFNELGLKQLITLDEAIIKTFQWNKLTK